MQEEYVERMCKYVSTSRGLWIEVVSLTSELKEANAGLARLRFMYNDNSEMRVTAIDYHAFVSVLHEPMRIDTHLYTSASLWTASSSAITRKYYDQLLVQNEREKALPVSLQLIDCKEHIVSVTYSPDGGRIVSGLLGGLIQIKDALSSASIGAPLQGHTRSVIPVAYSNDGLCIVSKAKDNIHIWDAHSGAPIVVPLEGYTDWMNSVAFSPDGSHIVSGSVFHPICIWAALTGAAIGGPVKEYSEFVLSVACLPDGSCIISGSADATIRIRDAPNRAPIGAPLVGHTGSVSSGAYSPDGSHIVSGSFNRTIRIWAALSGAPSAS